MAGKLFYFDSYAIIELNSGNEKYKKYSSTDLITTILNIGEVYYHYLKHYNKLTADYWRKKMSPKLLSINESDIIEAMKLKFEKRKSKLSMVDCIGYILAKKNNLKFLTGDREFKDMENVEFVNS